MTDKLIRAAFILKYDDWGHFIQMNKPMFLRLERLIKRSGIIFGEKVVRRMKRHE